jgi:hypothetical protein
MAILSRFDTPGRLEELSEDHRFAWSRKVAGMMAGMIDKFTGQPFPQFYNPTVDDTPSGLRPAAIAWPAFPARVQREEGPGAARWDRADSSRDEQDEYCEWSVERDDDGKISRITFTTEVPDYWEHVAQNAPDLLLELYHQFVDPRVERDDLFDDGGEYVGGRDDDLRNQWNRSTEGRLAHLVQGSNKLSAAIDLVARATIMRMRQDGTPVTDRQELVRCAGLGEPLRNSDPQIAKIVNDAAALGDEITLLDPVGLYLDELQSAGMETPDGADAAEFWQVERGAPGHAVRASFAVPEDRDYVVGDININGLPITRGAQVADNVSVRIDAVVKPGDHQLVRRRCGE